MHVSISGGPIHDPHQEVLQLLIRPWGGNDESWTVYQHQDGGSNEGKIVHKKWDTEKDLEKFRLLGDEKMPKDWLDETSVAETSFSVPGVWVVELEKRVASIDIPLITLGGQPLSRLTNFRLSLWCGREESEFEWEGSPSERWSALEKLFKELETEFIALRQAVSKVG